MFSSPSPPPLSPPSTYARPLWGGTAGFGRTQCSPDAHPRQTLQTRRGLRAPELLNSVVEFFRAADADGDGCLDAVEGDAFAALLDDRYLYGADDNSSDDAGSFDDAGSYDGAGIDDDGGSDYEDADGRSDASDWPPELVEELQPIS